MRKSKDKPTFEDWLRGMLDKDEDFVRAMATARTRVPLGGRDYDWVIAHADEQFKLVYANITGIEEKAASVIAYLGGFVGLAAVAAVHQAATVSPWIGLCLLPTVTMALRAINLATCARAPRPHPYPPNAEEALNYAEAYSEEVAEMRFALVTCAAFEAAKVAASVKGDQLQKAMRSFAWSLWALLLPCAVAVAVGFTSPGAAPQ